MAKNPFQQAVVELNCLVNGYVDKDGNPDELTLKALGGGRHMRFLAGNGSTAQDCQEGDFERPVQLSVAGFGHVEGKDLAEAVELMKERISFQLRS